MKTITTQTRKMIRSTLIAGLAVVSLMTASAFATNYCDEAKYKQVSAFSDYTTDTHIHLDVACPYDYQAISCEFDVEGKNDHGLNQHFVAINDASPYQFGSNHSGHHLDGDYGCHFRANNFMPFFPGYQDFYWRLKGTATCVPKHCVHVENTHDYYDESADAAWFPEWDQGQH
jgi:hypothetical protein